MPTLTADGRVGRVRQVGRVGREGAVMAVRVRMFAALREAAGTSEVSVAPAPLPDVLDELRQCYGEPFTSRLSVASVLVDGDSVDRDENRWVPEGAEVALLPPFSGGTAPRRAAPSGERR